MANPLLSGNPGGTHQFMVVIDGNKVMLATPSPTPADGPIATLIHIKSKMLVPVDPTEAAGDENQEDPRDALVQRLLEFQRYKEAAGVLHQKGQVRAATWTRPDSVLPAFDDAGEEMLEAGLFEFGRTRRRSTPSCGASSAR